MAQNPPLYTTYKRTSSKQEIQVSDILCGLNVTKPKKIKGQEQCEKLDKGCVEIEKDRNQSSTEKISGDKLININFSFNVN